MDIFSGHYLKSVHLLGEAEGESLLQGGGNGRYAVPLAFLKGLSFGCAEFDVAVLFLRAQRNAGRRDVTIRLAVSVKGHPHVPGKFFSAVGKEHHLFHALLLNGEFDTSTDVVEGESVHGPAAVHYPLGSRKESSPVKGADSGCLDIGNSSFNVIDRFIIVNAPPLLSCRLVRVQGPEVQIKFEIRPAGIDITALGAGEIGRPRWCGKGSCELLGVQEIYHYGIAVFPEDGAILLKNSFGGIAFTGGADSETLSIGVPGYFLAGTGCKGKKCRKNIYSLFHGFQSLMVTSNLLHRFLRCHRKRVPP